MELPASVRTLNQKRDYGYLLFVEDGQRYRIKARVRHDDECRNGHNTFSITADIQRVENGYWCEDSCGCLHDEVAKHFPDLAPFIKWHLCSTDGPMGYVPNTIYHAGDRDHWGLRKDEFKPFIGKDGVPVWHIPFQPAYDLTRAHVKSFMQPEPLVLQYAEYGTTGEGKERELDAARRAAIWPDATDEELMQHPDHLKVLLLARLPALMAEFKDAVTSLGFVY